MGAGRDTAPNGTAALCLQGQGVPCSDPKSGQGKGVNCWGQTLQHGILTPPNPSAPSLHPNGMGVTGMGDRERTGTRMHRSHLLETTRRGAALRSSPVSRGICTRRQDRCNRWWLSEQLCRLPHPLALNVSFEFSCYF